MRSTSSYLKYYIKIFFLLVLSHQKKKQKDLQDNDSILIRVLLFIKRNTNIVFLLNFCSFIQLNLNFVLMNPKLKMT